MAVCVAVLARQNYPLYMRTIPSDNTLKFHYIVHSSLDVIEERLLSRSSSDASARESYLGFLFPIEDFKVYGYVTNCKVKFVILLESSNLSVKDSDVKNIFKKLHNGYSEAVSNPFYNNGETIKSTSFDRIVNSVMSVPSNAATTDGLANNLGNVAGVTITAPPSPNNTNATMAAGTLQPGNTTAIAANTLQQQAAAAVVQ